MAWGVFKSNARENDGDSICYRWFEMLSHYASGVVATKADKAALNGAYTQVVDRALSLERELLQMRKLTNQQFKANQNRGDVRDTGKRSFNQGPYNRGNQRFENLGNRFRG